MMTLITPMLVVHISDSGYFLQFKLNDILVEHGQEHLCDLLETLLTQILAISVSFAQS